MNTSTKRQQLLDTGVMFAVRFFRDPNRSLKQGLGFLSPTEIADHVGCSRSLIYHLWAVDDATDRGAAFEAYLGDVAEQMSRHLLGVDDLVAEISQAQRTSTSLDEVVRRVCAVELTWMVEAETRALALTDLQLRTVAVDSVRVRESFRAVDDAQKQQLVQTYTSLFEQYGRVLRPGFTYGHLADALWAVSNGFLTAAVLDPASASEVIEVDGESWTPYAIAIHSVLTSFSQPA